MKLPPVRITLLLPGNLFCELCNSSFGLHFRAALRRLILAWFPRARLKLLEILGRRVSDVRRAARQRSPLIGDEHDNCNFPLQRVCIFQPGWVERGELRSFPWATGVEDRTYLCVSQDHSLHQLRVYAGKSLRRGSGADQTRRRKSDNQDELRALHDGLSLVRDIKRTAWTNPPTDDHEFTISGCIRQFQSHGFNQLREPTLRLFRR